MQDIQGLANFLDDFMGGLQLIAYAMAVGGVLWALVVYRVSSDISPQRKFALGLPAAGGAEDAVPHTAAARMVRLIQLGAYALAVTQATEIIMKGIVIATTLGEFDFLAYAGTVQFIAGVVRILLSAVLGWYVGRLRHEPFEVGHWRVVYLLTLPLILGGAWLVHAVGRFEYREPLMLLTIAHQLAAAVWVGGVIQLVALWHLQGNDEHAARLWPTAVVRFGVLGVAAVALLLATGSVLTFAYVGSWAGLLGSGYGSLVATKLCLLVVVLAMAWYNRYAGQGWQNRSDVATITGITPYVIEAEAFVLVSILFIAATLSSQPPAVDIPELTAKVGEVLHMFAPRIPQLHSPSHAELLAGEVGRVAIVDKVPSVAGAQWSDFNHNIAGIFLTCMGVLALLSYHRWFRWARYWPAGFIGLGVFLFFRSDAETWPLGPIGFWESTFGNGEVLQHRMATFLALGLGVMEIKARVHEELHPRLPYVFAALCALGGILLLTHAHSEFELKTEFLIQVTHTNMGMLAVLMAAGRWMELRLKSTAATVAGVFSMVAMVAIGFCLMFYKEPLF
ncbi:MAG: CopD family protein [Methylococcaceae bacterium]|nr:MAG: CopD family protein [Methylococcaceae bacterium]